MPDPSAVLTYSVWAADVAGLAFIAAIAKKAWPIFNHAREFFLDWRGEADRPGFPGRPGVPERLEAVEKFVGEASQSAADARAAADAARLAVHDSTLATAALAVQIEETRTFASSTWDQVRSNDAATSTVSKQLAVIVEAVYQLQPNGGTTLRDAITRIEGDTASAAGRPIPPQAAQPFKQGDTPSP